MILQRLDLIAGRLRAQLALETPAARRVLVAVLLLMPGGLGIVLFYVVYRSLRGAGGVRLVPSPVPGPVRGRVDGRAARRLP
jgi:hypothetical protein